MRSPGQTALAAAPARTHAAKPGKINRLAPRVNPFAEVATPMRTEPTNLLILLSDEHTRDVLGCYGNRFVQTPNLDRLAERGTVFSSAYTPCPICVPARAAIATGLPVHRARFWDNGMPYDGSVQSWHHELSDRGAHVASIGKLHFDGPKSDHGFTEEIEPLHVVDGIGDVLGCIRDDPPRRHKRPGIDEAGPGDSSYQSYDTSNADRACEWLRAHARDSTPWALQTGFVLPHPPYLAPAEYYERYAGTELPMPPEWKNSDWPDHPVLNTFRSFFDFSEPFPEETVRRLVAAYYGMVSYLDAQIGRVLEALEQYGLTERTYVVYTSDHGESFGARGLFGKFTMYEESAAVPLILAGPDVPSRNRIESPVSLLDLYPTALEALGIADTDQKRCCADRPGRSLLETIKLGDRHSSVADRAVMSEYHALGCRRGFYMLRHSRHKYVEYVDAPPQLFDLAADPEEKHNLAAPPPETAG
ncbi:MAG: hypothetical protein EA426_01720, partial [Spirochaetaceae bacterium]